MPSASIKDANEAYLKAAARSGVSKRGSCVKLTGVQQTQIARYAFAHGNKEAIRYYTKQYCVPEIADSSVSTWKAKYTEEMKRKRKAGEFELNGEVVVHSIPSKRRGRPLLIGDELDEQLKVYVRELRARRAGIDTTVLIACGEAIVSRVDKKLLKVHGGPIDLSKNWAKSLLGRMGYVER